MRTTSIARPHAEPDPHARLTVVVGGDGTFRAVAGALLQDPHWGGAILPVPTGTASLFALSAGMRTTAHGLDLLASYLSTAEEGTREEPGWTLLRCDVGWARIERAQGRTTSAVPFLVSAGIGHSGATLLHTPHWAKTVLGAAGYGVGAIGRLAAGTVTLRLRTQAGEPESEVHDGVWAAEFGNIGRIPAGITVFPHGGVRTGSLAGLLVSFPGGVRDHPVRCSHLGRRISGWGRIFRAGFRGGHEHVDALRLWTTEAAHVTADRPLAAHLDGESVGMVTGLRLRLVPAELPVVVPYPAEA
ncbi:diacylglycerol/lipid kinase family protein [Brevibacterium yomogidense]|uniref:diacylglycerol/lipid kinase family protein n=1 Tax=Brevibacterium yomogidense TaxID=946573 RepID=UPI0018DF0877